MITRLQLEALESRYLLNAALPILNSYPQSPYSIYLDFTGWTAPTVLGHTNVVTPQFHLDGTGPGFTPREINAITEVWQRVSEDYSPFNINVTTQQPSDLSHGHTAIVVIGGSYNDWFGTAAGGVTSKVGAFTDTSAPNLSYVFPDGLSDSPGLIGVCAAHEAGHQFGLNHQSDFDANGNLINEYSYGTTEKAPIMGAGYYGIRATWYVGTVDVTDGAGVEGYQNDEDIIASATNGFGYRPDAYGQSEETATPFNGSAAGVIDTPTSADWFTFTTSGGNVSISDAVDTSVLTSHEYLQLATLHASFKVFSATGLVAIAHANTLSQSLTLNLAPGKYYIEAGSYGETGDIGQYILTATFNAAQQPSFNTITRYVLNQDGSLYGADSAGNWLLLSPIGTILSISNEVGNQTYAIASDHSLWLNKNGFWTIISPANTITSIAAGSNNSVYALASDASLWKFSNSWEILSSGGTIKSLVSDQDGIAYVIASDSSLWSFDHSWTEISAAGTILQISKNLDGGILALANDNSLWLWQNHTWQNISPTGTILSVSSDYVVASNNSLWEFSQNLWTELSPADTILSITSGDDVNGQPYAIALTEAGSYWTYTESGWEQPKFK